MSANDPVGDAFEELEAFLEPGEEVKSLIFGGWGGSKCDVKRLSAEEQALPRHVPVGMRGHVLTLADAEPHMHGWGFEGGYGGADCYAVYVWTDRHIIWVHEYDGSTGLRRIPLNPHTEPMPVCDGDDKDDR